MKKNYPEGHYYYDNVTIDDIHAHWDIESRVGNIYDDSLDLFLEFQLASDSIPEMEITMILKNLNVCQIYTYSSPYRNIFRI